MVIDKRLCRKCSHTINIGLIKEAKPNGRQWIKANLPDVSHCVVTPNSFKRRVHHPGVYQFIGSNNHRQGLHLASILAILQVILSLRLIIHLCTVMDSLERTMMQMWNLRYKSSNRCCAQISPANVIHDSRAGQSSYRPKKSANMWLCNQVQSMSGSLNPIAPDIQIHFRSATQLANACRV